MTAPTPLQPLLRPESVAVIGASDRSDRLGSRILSNLRIDYAGRIIPVNPKRDQVQGLPSVASIGQVPGRVDLALLAVPADAVVAVAAQCAKAGVRAAVIFAAGFGEASVISGAGRQAQEELGRLARASGMRILGPNSLGWINLSAPLRASFHDLAPYALRVGSTAIVSQSGAIGTALLGRALRQGIGVTCLCSTGNEADLTAGEVIRELLEEPDVEVILAFLEGINDPEGLLAAGRRSLELGKPIVVLKAGTSPDAALAAQSHTGALAVPDRVVDAALRQAGIIRVPTPQRLIDTGLALSHLPPVIGPRIGVLAASGGRGVLLADAIAAAGLELPPGSELLQAQLAEHLPWFGSARNPVDCTAAIAQEPKRLRAILEVMATSEEFDALVVVGIGNRSWEELAPEIPEVIATSGTPIIVWSDFPNHLASAADDGLSLVTEPQSAICALRDAYRFVVRSQQDLPLRRNPLTPVPLRASAAEPRTLAQQESSDVLRRHGLPIGDDVIVGTADEAVAAAQRIGPPVALKPSVPWLAHRSDLGVVQLDLNDDDAVREAFQHIEATLRAQSSEPPTVLVQPMARRGLELLIGATRDATFGPVVTVGLGGTMTEILDDATSCLVPFSRAEAGEAVASLAGGRLMHAGRGLTATGRNQIAQHMVALGELLLAEPQVLEVDLNPLIVTGASVQFVDALVVVRNDPS